MPAAFDAPAGAGGKGRSLSSKFSTTRFNDTDDGAALASDSGRADSFNTFRARDASTRSR